MTNPATTAAMIQAIRIDVLPETQKRMLGITAIEDTLVQHAVVNVRFADDTVAGFQYREDGKIIA